MKKLVLIAATMAFAVALPPVAHAARPNILFVIADQWRACSTGYAGDPNVKTPNLDKLAGRSVDFTYAISACPVCTPFRASMQTGQRPTTHGLFINNAHLADDATTIAKVLSAAGYDTGYIGKWHIGGRGRLSYIPPESRQGFDYWKVMECTHNYNRSLYYADDDKEKRLWPGYDAAAQTEDAIAYLRDHAKSAKPFALFLGWGPPHNPYEQAPAQFQKMYDAAAIALRPNVPPAAAKAARNDLAGYYANCTALDQYIGQLVETLKSTGIEENTILVFTSDHGDMIGSHQMSRKQKPWDEALRVPMLWHYPAGLGAGGKRLDAVISSEDLMPTLLGFCGVAIPKSVEGLDYSTYMRGVAENPNVGNAGLISCVAPFGEWNRKAGGREFRGVRTARYTYVRDLNGPWLLYDDEADPYQMTNLVGTPAAAEVQAKLETLLQDRLKSAHDVTLRWLMLVTILAALALTFFQGSRRAPALPVTLSVIVPALGLITVLCLIYRVLLAVPGPDSLIEARLGAYLGLAAAIVLTYGGYRSLRQEARADPEQLAAIPTVDLKR